MTTQKYVDYISQLSSLSKEDLIKIIREVIKTKMRLTGKRTESFVFNGSRYIIEAPEKK